MKKRIGIMLMMVLLLALAGCSGGGFGVEEIDVYDYVEVRVDGLNEDGEVNVRFHNDLFGEELVERLGYTMNQIEEMYYGSDEKEVQKVDDMVAFKENIYLTTDNEGKVKNGDTFNVSIVYDEELADKLKVKLVYNADPYSVDGLEEPIVLDFINFFDNVDVSYHGVSPNVNIQVVNNSKDEIMKNIQLSVVDENGESIEYLKEGDKFRIIADVPVEELQYQGYRVAQDVVEKEYTIEGTDKYIESYTEITDEAWKSIYKEYTDKFKSKVYSGSDIYVDNKGDSLFRVDTNAVVGDFKIIEGHMLINKNIDGYVDIKNQLVLIIEVPIKGEPRYGNAGVMEHNFYFSIYSDNFIVEKNGEMYPTFADVRMNDGDIDIYYVRNLAVTRFLDEYRVEEIPTEYITEKTSE